jgi:RNA polymerase sigma-70 factor (ECF subfamily)
MSAVEQLDLWSPRGREQVHAPTNFAAAVSPRLPMLRRRALRLTRDPSDAEDLVQDTMVRAWRFWASFAPGSNLDAWLSTILRNTFINTYHRRERERHGASTVCDHVRSIGDTAAIACSGSVPPGADEAVDGEATQQRIRDALEQLPDDYRIAVTLADLEGLSYKDIADAMGCPIGTVMSRLYRGRKLLHALLFDHAEDLGFSIGGEPGERITPYTRIRP